MASGRSTVRQGLRGGEMRLTGSQSIAGKGGGERRCRHLCGPPRASVSPPETGGVRPEVTTEAPSSCGVTPGGRGAFQQASSSRAPWAGEWGPGPGGAMAAVTGGKRHGDYLRVALRRDAGCRDRRDSGARYPAPARRGQRARWREQEESWNRGTSPRRRRKLPLEL